MSDDEETTARTSSSSSTTPVAPPIDRVVVRDALREILNEIPSFRTLAASGTPPGTTDPGAATSSSSGPVTAEGGKCYCISPLGPRVTR